MNKFVPLLFLSLTFIQLIGPATVNTLVWSVRCALELDQDIVNKTEEKVNRVI
jgi:hypothetical protein